jgi:hypothetical protein
MPIIFPKLELVPHIPEIKPLLSLENQSPIMETNVGNTMD